MINKYVNPFEEITISQIEQEEYDLPCYSDRGWIIVDVWKDTLGFVWKEWDCEIVEYNLDSSVFWMQEGIGVEYWVSTQDFPSDGRYFINNIHGRYIKGEWGYDDDDEEWYNDEPMKISESVNYEHVEWLKEISKNNPIGYLNPKNPHCRKYYREVIENNPWGTYPFLNPIL